ncbi:hypothetical protein E1281_18715 [Actinomadura sp. KC345]|uniref:hypothetical protein n=1 Tax=Actinomadura sp. KC345 TaxID=2530371 RepID=UPI00104C681C|nr:hypothetical protein [Actinomadura sp. KC345]TDC52705.1 hypothetical protein E1281_18715 [Actinomadura sp. KC345]
MADSAAACDSQDLPGEETARNCIVHKFAAWALAALVVLMIAGAVVSFMPRGRRRRGTRRLPRPRPWQRLRPYKAERR